VATMHITHPQRWPAGIETASCIRILHSHSHIRGTRCACQGNFNSGGNSCAAAGELNSGGTAEAVGNVLCERDFGIDGRMQGWPQIV